MAGAPRAVLKDFAIAPDGPRQTPFLPILLYVLGFMGALALLALGAAAILRHL